MSASRRALLVLVLAVLGFAATTSTAAARTCAVGDSRAYGTTYVLAISATGASCAKAKRVIRAFHRCRPGDEGRCTRRVQSFACRERRFNVAATSYDGRVTCKQGRKRIVHTYTQFT